MKSLRFDRDLRQTRPDRVTSSRRLQPNTRKVEEESSFRSRTETDSTRKGDLIAKTRCETEAESPKELRFTTLGGQMVEAQEHTPEPTNWRGSTMKRTLTKLRLIRRDQQRTVHGRETSGNEAMARPLGNKPRRAAVSEGNGGTPTRTAQTPEYNEAREQSGPTGRLPAQRSQKQPVDQTGDVKTREREP